MKRIFTIASMLLALTAAAQNNAKKTIAIEDYNSWQSTGTPVLSPDGSIVAFTVNPQEGDGELVIRNSIDGKELRIERGTNATITRDGRWAFFSIKAPFQATRQAKIKKKKADDMPKDTAAYVDLKTFEIIRIDDAQKFTVSEEGSVAVYKSKLTIPADTVAKTKEKKEDITVVMNMFNGRRDTLKHVAAFSFDNAGKQMAVRFEKDKKDSTTENALHLYELAGMTSRKLDGGKEFYSMPSFSEDGSKLVWLASIDSAKTGGKHCSVNLYEEIVKGKGRKAVKDFRISELIPQTWSSDGLCVNENAAPSFTKSGNRILLGIGECAPEKDTTIVDFETASLDIWNYDIYMTPPMQKVRLAQLRSQTFRSVINLDSNPNSIVRIIGNQFENVQFARLGDSDFALVTDRAPYMISSTWDSNSWNDVYLVNLRDGSRRMLFEKLSSSTPRLSPSGNFIVWFEYKDLAWKSMKLADGSVRDLTSQLDGIFYDDEDDHPDDKPASDNPHWIEGEDSFILADKFDIWKIAADGSKAVCLTAKEGAKRNIQFKFVSIEENDASRAMMSLGASGLVNPKRDVMLTVFDRNTKDNGFASVSLAKPGLKSCFADANTYASPRKARNSETIVFKKSNVKDSPDIYTTNDLWKTSSRHSAINPQQKDFNWMNVQLVKWTAYDGTELEGLLYTPENLDVNGSYPMMVYFYEKYSNELNAYRTPSPSRSTVNFPTYASNGYVVFIPDIVYVDGHPGESAYNCICSGAEAMCDQFKFIDRKRMAIQGQSWGGYQTAYLVTRTDMFAAAGAGAPVGNMTSAYGGIRWESGMVRAMQYEHGQSRIGTSLWADGGLDLYIENSPIFHADKVKTPVLIMHNDADGAVPWYQGIEFFMSLRRFGNPAWLLQYNDEAHNLVERRNCMDLSRRLQQFFDHYLKGAPAPAWMVTGVPQTRKGQYFGFELTE